MSSESLVRPSNLGASWADEGFDVAWLVGCHFWARGLSEKGPQHRRRANTVFTHFPIVFDEFRRFSVDRGLAAKEPQQTPHKSERTHMSNEC